MRKLDPLALAFFGAAIALLAGLLLYVTVFKTPEPATPARAFDFVESLRRQIAGLADKIRDKPAAKPTPKAIPAPPAAAAGSGIESGRTWRYSVVVEPPVWRDITLTYRTQREGANIGVLADFVHAGGKTNFHLGTFAAGHASHANTRFPGFFMYASYFPPSLQKGQRLKWQWPWQPVREGRFKNYEGTVMRWEDIQVPAGTFRAAVIEVVLEYYDGHVVRARVSESLWYSPAASQVVKVIREGKSPDEASARIVAELQEFR